MPRPARPLPRYRLLAAALAVSLALHAAIFVGLPSPIAMAPQAPPEVFTARLEPEHVVPAPPAPTPAPRAAPVPRRVIAKRRAPAPRPPAPAPVPPLLVSTAASPDLPSIPPPAPPPPEPEPVALAEAIVPWLPQVAPAASEPPAFPMEGLPERLSIDYRLSSGILDAHAVYHWVRDGDSYRITGEGAADGLFHLFLHGSIEQVSVGTITSAGLRPERFVETKPGSETEGLQFDWPKRTVTFEFGDQRKTSPLRDDTVDWLTMIFQLAHVPPKAEGDAMTLRVFTQRKLYTFHLKVLGVEDIDIPMGRVRALHLRHVDPEDGRVVDVWLGIDQHYLPVKMRYPATKLQLMVEQSAASITER